MRTSVRPIRLVALFLGLLILSQLETACGDGSVMPHKEQASSLQAYAPGQDAADAFAPPEGRKVIVSHNLALEVDDITPAFEAASSLAAQSGGYNVSTNRSRNPDGSYRADVSMRVPGAKAPEALAKLRGLGKVVSEGSTGEDITEGYVDLEARLANLRASEDRLVELMQRQAAKLSDVLDVERELTRVRGEIESMEARKRSWDTQTAMVAIAVSLSEPPRAMPSARKVWHPIKTALGQAVEALAQSLHYAIIFMGAMLPWIFMIGILVWVAVRVARRKKKQG